METPDISEPTVWRRDEWTATVVKNEDDDGWAVEVRQAGQAEPALIGPWTMGRDKKNPKPLDNSAFLTLVKTAKEVIRRHEHHARARLHKGFEYTRDNGTRVRVDLDIVEDEDDPHAILACTDAVTGEALHRARVATDLKLTAANVERLLGDRR
jgi:hypothetical protein